MKMGSPKMKNVIASHGIDESHTAELLKEKWRAFRSMLKASPNLMKMDVEKLKDIHVLDHLLKRKKRSCSHVVNSTSRVLTLHHLSHPVHEAAEGRSDLSLMIEGTFEGSGASQVCSVSNIVSVEEVDELADAFISRFYNNMRLERQQSYSRYEEMLARGT